MKKAILILSICWLSVVSASEYFQQQADYTISARLLPRENKVIGSMELTYSNNSNSELDTLYFHLYLNAFKSGSNFDDELRRRGSYYLVDMSPYYYGSIDIIKVNISGSEVGNYLIDDTIMRLPLNSSLKPGESLKVYFEFESTIPARGYRLGRRGSHFDIGQWYPKVAVYDNFGWHINQFQSMSEQYADFGTYDISLTTPDNYIVAHCGTLLNETEVYGDKLIIPDEGKIVYDLLGRIDSLNAPIGFDDLFNNIILDLSFEELTDYRTDSTKTWLFHAENVHDFAFSAAKDFKVDRANVDGIIIDSYYKAYRKDDWSPRAIATAVEAMSYFNDLLGRYPYEHYTLVASTVFGGIEYPSMSMVIMYGGRDKEDHGFENVIAHELVHNWFFGAIASNQAEQAFIDEGFTTYLTTRFMEHKYGRYHNNYTYEKKWQKRLLYNGDYRNDLFKNYIDAVYNGYQEKTNMPANQFKSMTSYRRATYDKPAVMLYHLQHIMGESKFQQFLRELYRRYKFKHLYLKDIEGLTTEIYNGNLRYFFNQWYDDTSYLDFGLNGLKLRIVSSHGVNWYRADFKLKRYGQAISPLDLVVWYENGEMDTLWIPETVWADGRVNYHHIVNLPLKPVHAELNPDGRIPDINRLNNCWRWPKARFQFDTPKILFKDAYIEHYPESYTLYHQPKIWYNEVDGVKLGYSLNGSYLGKKHEFGTKTYIGTLNGRIDYDIRYGDILTMRYPTLKYTFGSLEYDGRGNQKFSLTYERPENEPHDLFTAALTISRMYAYDNDYLSGSNSWQPGDINTFELELSKHRDYHNVSTSYKAHLTTAAPGSDFRFSRLTLAFDFIGRLIGNSALKISIMHGYSDGNTPVSHIFYEAQASPVEYFQNHWYSARGTMPGAWFNNGHLFFDDGVSMSGYSKQRKAGAKKLAARIEFELANAVEFFELPRNLITNQLAKITNSVYINHGAVWNDPGLPGSDDFEAEGGLHFTYRIPFWDRLFGNEVVHLFLPLAVSSPYGDEGEFKFRWALMIAPATAENGTRSY